MFVKLYCITNSVKLPASAKFPEVARGKKTTIHDIEERKRDS